MTFRSKPRKSRSANSCSFDASHGVYLRSGAYGNRSPGPNTWQCASTLPAGTVSCGLVGAAHQSSQPGVFSNDMLVCSKFEVRSEAQVKTYFNLRTSHFELSSHQS